MRATDTDIQVIEILADAGFVPADDTEYLADEYGVTGITAETVAYYTGRGWDCVRFEQDGMVTFARTVDDDERVDLMVTTGSGVIDGELSFPTSARGFGWLASVVNA